MTDSSPPEGKAPEVDFSDLGRAFWRKLKEMRTAFYLLVVIAVGSLIAAVVPQNEPGQYYTQHYGQVLGNLVTRLGLNHVSTATWFTLLLALLMLSLAACSQNLWRLARGRWRTPDAAGTARLAGNAQESSRRVAGSPQQAVAAATQAGRRRRFHVWDVGTKDGARCLYLCRHRWTAWGTMLAHYAIFLVALGSLLGSLPGLAIDEYIQIAEGQTHEAVPGLIPFEVRLNEFRIEHNPDKASIENYYSDLSVVENGQEVVRRTISVNHPLKYRGYYISQSSWSLGEARVALESDGQKTELTYPLAKGTHEGVQGAPVIWGVPREDAVAFLPGGTSALVAVNFYLDATREGKEVKPRPSETLGTPALNLMIVSGLPKRSAGLLPASPTSHTAFASEATSAARPAGVFFAGMGTAVAQTPPSSPHGGGGGRPGHSLQDLGWLLEGESLDTPAGKITFTGVTASSGLGVRRDPGVPLVWIGFIGCLLGLVLVFYFPLEQGYVMVTGEADEKSKHSQLRVRLRGGMMSDLDADTNHILSDVAAATDANDSEEDQ